MSLKVQEMKSFFTKSPFKKIGLFAKHNSNTVADTLEKLIHFLKQRGHIIIIESQSAKLVPHHDCEESNYEHLGEGCDLVIVVGGDGSLGLPPDDGMESCASHGY